MKNHSLLILGLLAGLAFDSGGANFQRLSREELRDKIRGAWAGQMIGVSYGASTEFRAQSKTFDAEIKPDSLSNAIRQDDLCSSWWPTRTTRTGPSPAASRRRAARS